MPIPEEVQQLRTIAASDEIPIKLLHAAKSSLELLVAPVAHILGETSGHLPGIRQFIAAATQSIDDAIARCKGLEQALWDASDAHARG